MSNLIQIESSKDLNVGHSELKKLISTQNDYPMNSMTSLEQIEYEIEKLHQLRRAAKGNFHKNRRHELNVQITELMKMKTNFLNMTTTIPETNNSIIQNQQAIDVVPPSSTSSSLSLTETLNTNHNSITNHSFLPQEKQYLKLHCDEFNLHSPIKYDHEFNKENFGLVDTPIKHEYLGDIELGYQNNEINSTHKQNKNISEAAVSRLKPVCLLDENMEFQTIDLGCYDSCDEFDSEAEMFEVPYWKRIILCSCCDNWSRKI